MRAGKRERGGRPPREDDPTRLTVLVPGELRRWLKVYAAATDQDMGDVVSAALSAHRLRIEQKGTRKGAER